MNSQQKYEEQKEYLLWMMPNINYVYGSKYDEIIKEIEDAYPKKGILKDYDQNSKPAQYQIGIDTFDRMEANCSKEEILAFCKGNIDKYTWRTKGCDLEDFKKIIDYANFAIKQLEK